MESHINHLLGEKEKRTIHLQTPPLQGAPVMFNYLYHNIKT